LLCLLALAAFVYSWQQRRGRRAVSAAGATFDFGRSLKNKPFVLNSLPTTPYGPPWATY